MKKSIAAGFFIGLSCFLYQNCQNNLIGAFLFGLGLVIICTFKLFLFTGQVGKPKKIAFLSKVLLFNIIGILLGKILFSIPILGLGIVCGVLMEIAVNLYSINPFLTMLCVMSFILSGSKHCIAMVYNLNNIPFWIAIVVGNTIGAKIAHYLIGVQDKQTNK